MVGGPIGGFLSDKVFKSPLKYLQIAFVVSVVSMLLFIQLPHESMNVYLGMTATLGFGAIIFTQRAVFFAPMEEVGVPREYAGSSMALGCLIGYMPSMFGYAIYGYMLDTYPGIAGYNKVFYIMAAFGVLGLICATLLLRRISKK